MHVFATASLRNISNSQAAVTEIEDRTGLSISLLSGAQEAEYDFVGAARTVDYKLVFWSISVVVVQNLFSIKIWKYNML